GIMTGPEKGDQKFALVAAKDISQAAYTNLQTLDFKGKSVEYVLGERDLSYNEIAEIYGKAIGISNLRYKQVSEDDLLSRMAQMGVKKVAAEKLYEVNQRNNQWNGPSYYTRNKA